MFVSNVVTICVHLLISYTTCNQLMQYYMTKVEEMQWQFLSFQNVH